MPAPNSPMPENGSLSVVVPIYNGSATVDLLVERLTAALRADGPRFEIILVNDGSEDDRSDVRAYLETMVGKGDTVALLAVSRWKSAAVVQEIQRVEEAARPESVRRLQLDLDEEGREGLARLRRDVDAGVVPTPAVIRQSSRERYQVLRSSSSATRRSRR